MVNDDIGIPDYALTGGVNRKCRGHVVANFGSATAQRGVKGGEVCAADSHVRALQVLDVLKGSA
jgi:hypothetical protein